MDREREELAKKIENALRPRIERVLGGVEELKGLESQGAVVGTPAYILLSEYLLFHSSERLKTLTQRLNWLTFFLIVLTALTLVATLKIVFRW